MSFNTKEKAVAYQRAYAIKNRAEINRKAREYNAKNREAARARDKRCYQKHRERYCLEQRLWREANRDEVNRKYNEHRAANVEAARARERANRLKRLEHYRAKTRRLYWKHVERRRVDSRKYTRGKHAVRKARMLGVETNLAGVTNWLLEVRSRILCTCYFCQQSIMASDVEIDHVIPLAKGGPHALSNLAVACLGCNRSKSSKMPSKWITKGQLIMDL